MTVIDTWEREREIGLARFPEEAYDARAGGVIPGGGTLAVAAVPERIVRADRLVNEQRLGGLGVFAPLRVPRIPCPRCGHPAHSDGPHGYPERKCWACGFIHTPEAKR